MKKIVGLLALLLALTVTTGASGQTVNTLTVPDNTTLVANYDSLGIGIPTSVAYTFMATSVSPTDLYQGNTDIGNVACDYRVQNQDGTYGGWIGVSWSGEGSTTQTVALSAAVVNGTGSPSGTLSGQYLVSQTYEFTCWDGSTGLTFWNVTVDPTPPAPSYACPGPKGHLAGLR